MNLLPRPCSTQKIVLCLIFAGLALLRSEITSHSTHESTVDNIYYNLWHQLAGTRSEAENTALVVIDDQTLSRDRKKPLLFWGPELAHVLNVLRNIGVRHIGIDLIFSVNPEKLIETLGVSGQMPRSYDAAMRKQLFSGNISLAAMKSCFADGGCDTILPREDYLAILPNKRESLGVINLQQDSDGVIRRFATLFPEDDSPPALTFPTLLAVEATGQDSSSPVWRFGQSASFARSKTLQRIGFVGPPGTIKRISFSRLLAADAENDPEIKELANRVIIVAVEHTGLQDIHHTPYSNLLTSSSKRMMTGGEIHANVVETLLTGVSPQNIGDWWRRMLVFSLVFTASFIFFSLSSSVAFATAAASIVLLSFSSLLLFKWSNIWISIAELQAALGLSYLACVGIRLTGEERERARIRKIFGRYVSDEVVTKIIAEQGIPKLGGETRQITVLFADIRNFTSMSEKLDPTEVVEMLNKYFSLVCGKIQDEGGIIDKYIGDAVMALFGAPATLNDHAPRAVATALAMIKATEEMKSWMQNRFADKGLLDFQIGIGLHTGVAVVGNIGSENRVEYTAIGDTVNLASRLESMTKETGWPIVASKETVAATNKRAVYGNSTFVQVKGKKEPVQIYEITGLKDD